MSANQLENLGVPRDYDALLEALKARVSARNPTTWNSFNEGELGKVLLDAIAWSGTASNFTLDALHRERFIDTLQHRESLVHFANLSGYSLRRSSAVRVQVYARVDRPPAVTDFDFVIPNGTRIRSKNGQGWEVAGDFRVLPGKYTPIHAEGEFGDIKAVWTDGQTQELQNALVHVRRDSPTATLCAHDGTAFAALTGFGQNVSVGSTLVLGPSWDNADQSFKKAPSLEHNEYAIVSIVENRELGQFGVSLQLDRPFSAPGDHPFIGRWSIENRNITLVQGETRSERFVIPSQPDISGYKVKLAGFPVLAGDVERFFPAGAIAPDEAIDPGIKVRVNSQEWAFTPSLMFERSDSMAFEVLFDEFDRATLRFGDGRFGKALQPNDVLNVAYRIGGGDGNVPVDSFDTSLSVSIASQPNTPVNVSITNPYTTGSGGSERESLDEARRNIPRFIRANDRAVTAEDYAYLATNFQSAQHGKIALAKGVLHSNLVPIEQNVVWVHAWVRGPEGSLVAPSSGMRRALHEYMTKRRMITDEVIVVGGGVRHVPLHIRFRRKRSWSADDALRSVQDAAAGVFARQLPGEPLKVASLYAALKASEAIEHVNVFGPFRDVIPPNEFEVLVNSIGRAPVTRLAARANQGSMSLIVNNPSGFSAGGLCSIFEAGVLPECHRVVSVDGNLVTLGEPLASRFTQLSLVTGSSCMALGWAFELPARLFCRIGFGPGAGQEVVKAVAGVVRRFFRETVRPEEVISKSELVALVTGVDGVEFAEVFFGTRDSTTESIQPSQSEKVVLDMLSINDVLQAP